ncbi:MAG: FtsX-like permease family protein [Ruminococcaceae bacterium]|nr:FtsX-like permease family protein [Oscillospiraceae bacterium]
MSIFETFSLALSNIWSSKMRSFLTMLGIIIGIASVMVIAGFGDGMENYITESFQSAGTNVLTVSLTGTGSSSTVKVDDMYDMVEENSEILDFVSPKVTMRSQLKIGTETYNRTSVTGVGEEYFDIYDYKVEKGREFRYIDMEKRTRVCIIGSYVDSEMFDGQSLGQTLRMGGEVFTVIGVLENIDDEPRQGGSDDVVYIPYSIAARLSYSGTVSSYVVTVKSDDLIDRGQNLVENELFEILRSEDAYTVTSLTVLLDMMTEMIDVVILVLTFIAGISLVVGGIGIMNIMLVSVSERTREIGIRKALGAKESAILSQFVIEAALTSAIGGIIGILCGYGLSTVATNIITNLLGETLTVSPSATSIAVAFGVSALIGIAFGYLPARKAAVLNPIDALRYE